LWLLFIDWTLIHNKNTEILQDLQAYSNRFEHLVVMISPLHEETLLKEWNAHQLPYVVMHKPVNYSILFDALMDAMGGVGFSNHENGPKKKNYRELLTRENPLKLLMVEDNETNRQLTVELLAMANIATDLAVDGQDALDLAGQTKGIALTT
jgi:PleD family two-component response regulator